MRNNFLSNSGLINTFLDTHKLSKKTDEEEDDLFKMVQEDQMEDEEEELFNLSIFPSDLKYKKMIGEGGFGIVYEGTYKGTKEVAIKKSMKSGELKREKDILQKFNDPKVVKLIGFVEIDSQISTLVFEKLDSNLKNYFLNNVLSHNEKMDVCYQTSKALSYLHDNLVYHGDIKPENFLISTDSKRIVIADFGFSVALNESGGVVQTKSGSFEYVAPEIAKYGTGFLASDVFSFAITISFFLLDRRPYSETPERKLSLVRLVVNNNLRPTLPKEYINSSMETMIKKSWDSNYLNRPSMKSLFQLFEKIVQGKF